MKGPFAFTLIVPVLLLSVVATGFAEEELWTMTDEKVIYNTLLGHVGIGTDNPQATLHVADSSEPTIRVSDQNGEHALLVLAGSVGWGLPFVTAGDLVVKSQNGDVVLYGQTGAVRLATNGQEVLTVEDNFVDVGSNTVTANLRVFGTTTTDIIEITGGSDLAERFDVSGSEEIEPGMVMCIDPDRPGMLRLARDAYDRTVAGVVSGAGGVNPGVMLRDRCHLLCGRKRSGHHQCELGHFG